MTQKWQQMDHTTTCIAMVLCLFGLMMMTSAFAVDGHGASLLMRQGMFLLLGFALVYGVCLLSHDTLLRGSVAMLALGIVMLVAVLFVGNSINGATRWLPVGKWLSLGSLSVQPVELVKPAFALVSAWLFVRLRERGNSIDFLLPPAILAIIVFLLLGQPDVGTEHCHHHDVARTTLRHGHHSFYGYGIGCYFGGGFYCHLCTSSSCGEAGASIFI